MTSTGCPYTCSFCFAKDIAYRHIPLDIVAADIARRQTSHLDIGDSVFGSQRTRIRELRTLISGLEKQFSCELTLGTAKAETLTELRAMGVHSVKLGVESGNQNQLRLMNKRQTPSKAIEVVNLCKELDLHVSVYVLLGGPEVPPAAAHETLQLCLDLDADDYVINVWAYENWSRSDFEAHCHFSMELAEQWGVSDYLPQFFALQAANKRGLGHLVRN